MFEKFDGTDRQPRSVQTEVLKWLEKNWAEKILVANLPTGVGKSAILRAIQLEEPDTHGITPSNILLNQYTTTYSDLNYLKGMEHYRCKEDTDYSCQDKKNIGSPPCDGCVYKTCRSQALTHATVFNPISYYYFTLAKGFQFPKILVVDEAHQLIDTLMLLVDCSFRKGKYGYPEFKSMIEVIDWLGFIQLKNMELRRNAEKAGLKDKILEYSRFGDKLEFLLSSLRNDPQNFVYFEKEVTYRGKAEPYLFIRPVEPPRWLINKFFGEVQKIILMSATLLMDDIWRFKLPKHVYRDFASPIDKSRRKLLYRPATVKMNFRTELVDVANWIKKILQDYPDRNTVIHLSYSKAEQLRPFFPTFLFNTAETKDQVLKEFKEKGGVWLASGCSEGIDLPDDFCRLILVPFIILGNPNDEVVQKQMTLPGGRAAYELRALKTVIQQIGRGTRSETDYCTSVIGDSKFPSLILRNRKFLPTSFLEAIEWSTPK